MVQLYKNSRLNKARAQERNYDRLLNIKPQFLGIHETKTEIDCLVTLHIPGPLSLVSISLYSTSAVNQGNHPWEE